MQLPLSCDGVQKPSVTGQSEDSCMTELPLAETRCGVAVAINSPSFLTQSIKKQPRSPRDKQVSPKRARVGASGEPDDQDDNSSTEPGLLLDEALKGEDDAHPVVGEVTAGSSVFSPVFHCMRTLRSSLDAAHAQDAAQLEGLQPSIRQSPWGNPNESHQTEHTEPEPQHGHTGQGQHDLSMQQEHEHHEHHDQHGHHTVIPEAVEHELPPDANTEVEEDLDYMDFDPLLFIKLLPPLDQVVPKHRPALLPRKTRTCKKKTLVLDLDETLVHSCLEAQAVADFTFPVHFNSQEHIIHVRQRPHLHTFMNRVAELFEVVVFTASQKIYAEKLLNIIDPERRLIKHRIFRESCVVVDGNYLKDLSVLGRDLKGTLIVDNSPQAFGFQVDNGVPIESWYDDMGDTELLKLLPFLEGLVGVEDVRPAIRDKFRMKERIDSVVC